MGGEMMLLQSEVKGEIMRATVNHKPWWEAHFKEVTVWSPNLVAKGRLVWIKICGLPLHVWEEESFKKAGSMFGVFLDYDEATNTRQRLDFARVKVCTDRLGWISEQIHIKVMGADYSLFVVEDVSVEVSSMAVEAREGEGRSSDGSGGSGDEEVVGTEIGVHLDEKDDVCPAEVNLANLGMEVVSPRLSPTNAQMGQEEGLEAHFLGSQKIVTPIEEDILNQPSISQHVEQGDGDIRMMQLTGERVGPEADVGPSTDGPHAPGLVVEQETVPPAVTQGEENNGLETNKTQNRLEGVWESGPVLSPIGLGPVPCIGPLNNDISPNLITGTDLSWEGCRR
jgi:hypothetical protein